MVGGTSRQGLLLCALISVGISCGRFEELPVGAIDVCESAECEECEECEVGMTRCSGRCVDLDSSARHCGGCDVSCSLANAGATCEGGMCVPGVCNSGFDDCNNTLWNISVYLSK